MRISWKQRRSQSMLYGGVSFEMRHGGVPTGYVVAPLYDRDRNVRGYYWYGGGQNTAHIPVETVDEAKKQAKHHFQTAQIPTTKEIS